MPRERYGGHGRKNHQRRISLWPRYPLLTIADARRQARELMMQWAAGDDLPEPKAPSETTEAVIERWLEIDQEKKRGRERAAVEVRRALAPWLDKPIASIKRKNIQGVIDEIRGNSGPQAASRIAARLHRLFTWALQRQYVDLNPAIGVDVPAANDPRRRTLTDDELRAVWLACDELSFPFGPVIRLLMLTGARRMEVGHLPWSELNLDRAEWLLPAARAKNGVEHLVPLSPQAMAVIDALPRIDNPADLVFPGSLSGKRLTGGSFGRAKPRLDKASGVSDWVLHDLRRTFATGMQRLGVKTEVTEAVLNHVGGTRAGIVGVYQTYAYADEKRAALEAWGRHIDFILTGEPAKVVQLPKRGA